MSEISVAVETARRAGEVVRAGKQRASLRVSEKDSAINPVTEVDRASEALITSQLERAFPQDGILAEEGREVVGASGRRWIIDPLDGTTNFIAGYPTVAVSIALEAGHRLVAGVVYNPFTDELFVGEEGKGATLNGETLHVSDTVDLGESLLASGFPYDAWENEDNNAREWARFIRSVRSLRCDGSTALDLCRVACGQYDGFWEKGIYAWDIAAGVVIVREAGGTVSDYAGGSDFMKDGRIVAANGRLHRKMLAILDEVSGARLR